MRGQAALAFAAMLCLRSLPGSYMVATIRLLAMTHEEIGGQVGGNVVGFALALICIYVGTATFDKPHTNRNAATSLLMLGFALVVANLSSAYYYMSDGQLPAGVAILAALIDIGLIIPAFVLAMRGRIQIAQEPTRFARGKGQATVVFIIGGLHLISFAVGFERGFNRNRDSALAVDELPTAGQTYKFDGLGFELDAPTPVWNQCDAHEGTIAFYRVDPTIGFNLRAQSFEAKIPLDVLADQVTSLLRKVPDYEFVREYHRSLNGMDGICVCSRETDAGSSRRVYSVVWVSSGESRFYVLTMQGAPDDNEDVDDAADKMFARFHYVGGASDRPS